MDGIREFLRFTGKDGKKVTAVFGVSPEDCDAAVKYVRHGAPEVPVWLFATQNPWPETAELCQRVSVAADSMELLVEAEKALWSYWVALSVGTWTGGRGKWPVKAAALLIPPFRALIMNRQGDFFAATPASVARHVVRTVRDRSHSAWHRAKDIHRAGWLWFLGVIAQRLLWLSRRVFAAMHGDQPLVAPDCTPSGKGVTVFRYHLRQWDWKTVDRIVRESDCRYILFLAGDTEDKLEWAGGADTFAVSRQNGYRAWKACLFPIAPFRALEPGEASLTLAPVSNAILVDRAKLAALGIPKTTTPGAAWMKNDFSNAARAWTAAEQAASSSQDRARMRQARASIERQRLDHEAAERKRAAEQEEREVARLKQEAVAELRAAEARANKGAPEAKPGEKVVPWWDGPKPQGRLRGSLKVVECTGGHATLVIDGEDGKRVRLLVPDPAHITVIGGGEQSLGCGPQKGRRVTVEYFPKKNSKLATAGEVATIEFQ